MKSRLLFCLIFLSLPPGFSQTDLWEPIETNGFGSNQNYDAIGFIEFNDTLYVGFGLQGPGNAILYRSGTGIIGEWQQIDYAPAINTVKGLPSFGQDSGYFWLATGNPIVGTQVYRTSNGLDWIPISKLGFGNINGPASVPTPNMLLFQGSGDAIPYLYAASNSHGGSTESILFRTPYNNTDSLNWTTVLNFAGISGMPVSQLTYFYVWKDTLYMAGNGSEKLYKSSDGINFVPSSTTGFSPNDLLIACMIDYDGYLYASTNNQVNGGQLYRTSNGIVWENLTGLLPGHSNVDEELHDLDTTGGYLWITSYTDTALSQDGVPVWRSTDATMTSFIQSNLDGFGNPEIRGENSVVFGFKNHIYFGGPNYTDGGQIWRTTTSLSVSESVDACKVVLYPNPSDGSGILNFVYPCADINEVTIFDLTGRLISSSINIGSEKIIVQIEDLPAGIYIYHLQTTDDFFVSGKFIVR